MCAMCSWTLSHIHQELAAKRTRTKGIRELQGVDSGERKKRKREATNFFTLYNVLLRIGWSKEKAIITIGIWITKPLLNRWRQRQGPFLCQISEALFLLKGIPASSRFLLMTIHEVESTVMRNSILM